ncbi:MAG: hypothetical protein P5683_14370 [Limnospira sp. PMC 1279.21]|nr:MULTISPECIES: hypothetical protein [unclassified Limnospira]MDT9178761.1 hypothetical protein [Limnospira sp. PMC 1238.20]MDT9193999.1 hypothetical protein [Limnospira sp. PMC 1245.20]MDT9204187.1 hypothetical protein [Limnospira sp. PMC 1243.20]MDT9204188.1 hypothetical protein [Limnospira sp. PMC 1243.20]MDT9209393.1 hypothetical protein [Limnospira sp. PMC 1252.20]
MTAEPAPFSPRGQETRFLKETGFLSQTVGRVYEYSRRELIIDGRTRPYN